MQDFFMTTYSLLVPPLIGYVIWLLKEQKKDSRIKAEADAKAQKTLNEATKCLLRVKLIEDHDKFMERGHIPSYALSNYEQMYEAYHELGGNGMIEAMHDEIRTLRMEK